MSKKEMRKLDKKETVICEKKLVSLGKEVNWLEYQIEYNKMVLDRGLKLNFEQKEKMYKKELKEFEDVLANTTFIIDSLKTQLKDGVEVKPKNEDNTKEKEDMKYVG